MPEWVGFEGPSSKIAERDCSEVRREVSLKHKADIASVLAQAATKPCGASASCGFTAFLHGPLGQHSPTEQKMSSISTFWPHMQLRSGSGEEKVDRNRVDSRAMLVSCCSVDGRVRIIEVVYTGVDSSR
jgi:hypothetical protein